DWREARRYARAALALTPDLVTAAVILREADDALSNESLAAIQAAAQVTQRQLSQDRRPRKLPFVGLFGGLLGGLSFPSVPRVAAGGSSLLPIAGAATLFVLAGLTAFIALGQLSGSGEDGSPDRVAASATPAADGGSPGATPTVVVAGDSVEAPTIEAVGCVQLDDGVTLECRPTLIGAADSYVWAASDGEPATGEGDVFRTTFPVGGPFRVSLEVCVSGACNTGDSQAFVFAGDPDAVVSSEPGGTGGTTPGGATPRPTSTVAAGPPPPAAPRITAVSCTPSPAEVGDTVSCSGAFAGGPVASYDWSVNGILIASNRTLSGAYTSSGARTIGLHVCNAGCCDTETTTLTVT
ncbi:MAG: hypothetical protein DWG78_01225, partial [Chloroflexi bacterium]|nr:hypothetical protein [Chloroflexota bacterium]